MGPGRNSDVQSHVRRLWRHHGTTVPTPRRGPRQQLDLDDVIEAAIAIADTEGLAAVSTRAVAAKFGKSAMALYPYVGSKENLISLMQDHACALPAWSNPTASLADALETWALKLFHVYSAHPWLTELRWSQASQGPNQQAWLERLLAILDAWHVPVSTRAPVVTALYATIRATAQTATAYQRIDGHGIGAWRASAATMALLIPDFAERYPQTVRLQVSSDHKWQQAPRVALRRAVKIVARGVDPTTGVVRRSRTNAGPSSPS
jgi:AcrR family transcriptional regulator